MFGKRQASWIGQRFYHFLKSSWKTEILVMNGEGILVTRDQGQTWKNWEGGFESHRRHH